MVLPLVIKNLPANAGDIRDTGSIPGSGRSPGGGHGNPLQYSCLENPMDRGASRTWLKWLSMHHVALPKGPLFWMALSAMFPFSLLWVPLSLPLPLSDFQNLSGRKEQMRGYSVTVALMLVFVKKYYSCSLIIMQKRTVPIFKKGFLLWEPKPRWM